MSVSSTHSEQVKGHDEVDVVTNVKSGLPRSQLDLDAVYELSHAAGRMVKRPSLVSVLFGSHWNNAIDKGQLINH